MRYFKIFDGMQAVAKIALRDSEVQELERKLGQMEVMIRRIIEESGVLIERASLDPLKEKIIVEIEDLSSKFKELLNEISERL
jgi:hypothetical protein